MILILKIIMGILTIIPIAVIIWVEYRKWRDRKK
jgi:hypothetical protein